MRALGFLHGSLLALAVGVMAGPASAGNLITNGSFETTTATYNDNGTTVGTVLNNSDLSGWTVGACVNYCNAGEQPFDFLVTSTLASTGVWWYPSNINAGGLVTVYASPSASPDGGNAVGIDASNLTSPLQQALGNLVVGDYYRLTFYQASAQAVDSNDNTGYNGNWQVSLGSSTQTSTTMVNPFHGDTGWTQVTMTFTATATSELLSFLAIANVGGEPAFLLLDGVTLQDVPEPASFAVIGAGLLGVLVARRRRRQV